MTRILDVVTVNWNSGSHLRRCLASVEASVREGYEFGRVMVVDNASEDGSADGLAFSRIPIAITRNALNRGFAEACNQGAKGSRADYILFLNPDVCLDPDSLANAIRFMEEPGNARFGICGIQFVDGEGKVSRSCARFPTPRSCFGQMLGLDRIFPDWVKGHFLPYEDHLEDREVDQVMGAFFLVRSKVFEALAGFDKRFFVYFEDMDFSYRAYRSQWRSYHLAAPRAYHKGGGCSEQVKAVRLYYSLRSRILYYYKHFGTVSASAVMLGTLFVEPFSRLALAVARRSPGDIKETIQAYVMLYASLLSFSKSEQDPPPNAGASSAIRSAPVG